MENMSEPPAGIPYDFTLEQALGMARAGARLAQYGAMGQGRATEQELFDLLTSAYLEDTGQVYLPYLECLAVMEAKGAPRGEARKAGPFWMARWADRHAYQALRAKGEYVRTPDGQRTYQFWEAVSIDTMREKRHPYANELDILERRLDVERWAIGQLDEEDAGWLRRFAAYGYDVSRVMRSIGIKGETFAKSCLDGYAEAKAKLDRVVESVVEDRQMDMLRYAKPVEGPTDLEPLSQEPTEIPQNSSLPRSEAQDEEEKDAKVLHLAR